MQRKDARVAKAFTTMWTGYLENHAHQAGERAAIAYAADEAASRETVA